MNLNVLVRGQSNAIMMMENGNWAGAWALTQEVQKQLGFDGVKDTVTLVYDRYDGDAATAHSGTALIGEWLYERNGDWRQGWATGDLEQSLLNHVNGLPAGQKDDPTAVLWLHNEYDSRDAGLTAEKWMSAVRYDAAQVRAALGQSADTVPYLFVSAMPYWGTTEGHQAIREGMEALAADPAFNARIAARMLDTDIDNDNYDGNESTREYGGSHIDLEDGLQTAERAGKAIAEQFARYAKPGSPAAAGLDDQGPQVIRATPVGANQLQLDVAHDHAGGFRALDGDAAGGVGWSVDGIGATRVQVVDGDTLLVTFASALPAGGTLHYGYGYGRLAGADGSARGNAVYDDQGMPIWVRAQGLKIGDSVPVEPRQPEQPEDPQDPPGGLTLNGTSGADVLKGGALADAIAGLGGDDQLSGNGGDDSIQGGDGRDTLYGHAGKDSLSGGAGNDALRGGAGDDLLATGAGTDRILFGVGDGNDIVSDFALGTDRVQLVGVTASQVVAKVATIGGASGLQLALPGGETLFLQGVGATTAAKLGISGSFAAGSSTPGTGTGTTPSVNLVNGSAGDDWLKGTAGADSLSGGAGSDDLQGLDGNDILRGGADHDGLTGGGGADTFVFARGDGNDWVVDFTPGTDKIRLEGISAAQVTQAVKVMPWSETVLQLSFGNGEDMLLAGVTKTLATTDLIFA